MKTHLSIVIVLCLGLAVVLTHCGKKDDNKSTYGIPPVQVSNGKCLNLEKFLEVLHKVPRSEPARKYTKDITIKGSAHSKQNFLTLLNRSTFVYEDRSLGDFLEYNSAKQTDCNFVTLYNTDQKGQTFEIQENSDPYSAVLTSEGKEVLKFNLTSDNSLEIESHYEVEDPCDNEAKAYVDTTNVLLWGSSSQSAGRLEVSLGMLQNIIRSSNEIPVTLYNSVNQATDSIVTVTTEDLKALREAPILQEILGCFPPPPPPIPEPELPDESPSPSPSASPSPSPAARG